MKAENNNKGSRKSTSHGRPQSIILQKVSSDQESVSSGKKSSGGVKSKKQIKECGVSGEKIIFLTIGYVNIVIFLMNLQMLN